MAGSFQVRLSATCCGGRCPCPRRGLGASDHCVSVKRKAVSGESFPSSPLVSQLFMEKAEAEEKWFQRLVALRQERLMGSPVA